MASVVLIIGAKKIFCLSLIHNRGQKSSCQWQIWNTMQVFLDWRPQKSKQKKGYRFWVSVNWGINSFLLRIYRQLKHISLRNLQKYHCFLICFGSATTEIYKVILYVKSILMILSYHGYFAYGMPNMFPILSYFYRVIINVQSNKMRHIWCVWKNKNHLALNKLLLLYFFIYVLYEGEGPIDVIHILVVKNLTEL